MAWFQKVSLGSLPDIAGAVTKISESVKNIEKNFDSALGLEERRDENGDEEESSFPPAKLETAEHPSVDERKHEISVQELSTSKVADEDNNVQDFSSHTDEMVADSNEREECRSEKITDSEATEVASLDAECHSDYPIDNLHTESEVSSGQDAKGNTSEAVVSAPSENWNTVETIASQSQSTDSDLLAIVDSSNIERNVEVTPDILHHIITSQDSENKPQTEDVLKQHIDDHHFEAAINEQMGEGEPTVPLHVEIHPTTENQAREVSDSTISEHDLASDSAKVLPAVDESSSAGHISDPVHEMEKLKQEMKMLEAALQGAAKQAQAKADEIAVLMNENEQLKLTVDTLKTKSSEGEMDALREEYHQRVSSLERKVYALTKERDTLKREQTKKSDAAALLKEKDEIINQVMAEGEELSKKQAAQEATMRKLRAQIRELEEEKQRLNSKLQVEETKVDSLKRDKAATEKVLQETTERNQAELAAQKDFYTNALNAAKEAEALAEARVNTEAEVKMENRIKEAGEKEAILVQTLEELRHTLSRKEQEAAFREDLLKRDFDDLQKRYQASELRYNELVTQVPESTRPLLRQIEAMQETAARRAEAWAGVESALSSRLQEAEAKAAAAEERERLSNERLSQSSSRITVLETQIAILRTEQTQVSRSLEKERQRASESRQEYLAIKEEAATQEARARQLEDEIKELRVKQRKELQQAAEHRDLLEKELEREKNVREELQKASKETAKLQEPTRIIPLRRLSSAGSVEENNFLQSSLESSDSILPERKISGEISSYHLKSMTPSAFEIALRQKDGELASYMSRLVSLESIRDSLAEELVNVTEQCEKFRAEAATLPGIKAELEALKQRHLQALELMGERDEALEELRNDIDDVKEMYREQVDFLVNKISMLSARE